MKEIVKVSPEIDEVKLNKAEECHKDWLYDQYWNQGKSTRQMGRVCGVDKATILRWLRRFNIPRRESGFQAENQINLGTYHTKETKDKISTATCGANHYRWRGGKVAYHYLQAHRIWEQYWREEVPSGYEIHHVDRDVTNNDICNLALLTPSYHARVHKRGQYKRKRKNG